MKTKMTPRLERALRVLYTSFHEGTLDAFRCKACAVGSLLGHGSWIGCEVSINYSGQGPMFERLVKKPIRWLSNKKNRSGYSLEELSEVECTFLKEWEKRESYEGTDKEIQFRGLCAVVEYLCGLDGVENVMELQGLFERDDKGNAKVELESLVG